MNFGVTNNSAESYNRFDLTNGHATTMEIGDLVPVQVQEALPGDIFSLGSQALIRFAPMVNPVMSRMDVTINHFFVPNRLLWPNQDGNLGWENYIMSGNNANPIPHPYVTVEDDSTPSAYSRLLNYLGVPSPIGTGQTEEINAMVPCAYQRVYNDYYRPPMLENENPHTVTDGNNDGLRADLYKLRKVGYAHDYFTSALPDTQRGDMTNVPVGNFNDTPIRFNNHVDDLIIQHVAGGYAADVTVRQANGGEPVTPPPSLNIPDNEIYAQTSALLSGSLSIASLRTAIAIQAWSEMMERSGGTRYTEVLQAFFNVNNQDARLQRAEYIGGDKFPVIISEVLQTSQSDTTPQGNMAGHGISLVNSNQPHHYAVKEHGIIISIAHVSPRAMYKQGIPKLLCKTGNPLDTYHWPQFSHLTEQPVYLKELYAFKGLSSTVFGYQPKDQEYRFTFDRVSGDFQTSLETWVSARKFATTPQLNAEFIHIDTPTHNEIFAVTSDVDHLWCNFVNFCTVARRLPRYGMPQIG